MSKVYTNEELSQKVDGISESLNDKMDRDALNNEITPPPIYVVETGHNSDSTQFYRLWKDGFCEMWGKVLLSTLKSAPSNRVTFMKPLKDFNQANVSFGVLQYTSNATGYTDDTSVYVTGMSNTYIDIHAYDAATNTYDFYATWKVEGYV